MLVNQGLLQSKVFKYATGMYVKEMCLQSIQKEQVSIPDPNQVIHLQFRRFAGCPICNLHLQSFARQYPQLRKANIKEVIIFHSTEKELLKYTDGFPFSLIADPGKKLYKEYGVEHSPWALLHPKAFASVFKGILNSFVEYLQHKRPLPSFAPRGGSLGLPADFLISPDGKIIDSYYGRHADDHWSVEKVLQKTKLFQSNILKISSDEY